MTQQIRCIWTDDSGQDMVEYALLVALVDIAVARGHEAAGIDDRQFFNNVSNNVNTI